MKKLKIEISRTLMDFPLGKFQAVSEVLKGFKDKEVDIMDMVDLVQAYTGEDKDDLLNVEASQIVNVAGAIIKVVGSYERKLPPQKVTVQGLSYELTGGNKKWTAGEYVDIKTNVGDMETQWHLIPAIMYVPENTEYNDTSMIERANIFKEHFPAQVYLDVSAFFLPNSRHWTSIFLERLRKGMNLRRILNLRSGTKKRK